ncbi:hypothetical protein [Streptomyces sp. NRRL S-378]|uniref:hypothetical protein n=1 Tax=Streptomyces sp. NRRL S-378 TaxID=1463904 RepID=UPI0004CA19A7|nr:hypothetical protein [Streptomyces sp. NRRL S-378]
MCVQHGLTGLQRAAVDTYVEIMEAWMSGYHAWQTQTHRYTSAPVVLPATGPAISTRSWGRSPSRPRSAA